MLKQILVGLTLSLCAAPAYAVLPMKGAPKATPRAPNKVPWLDKLGLSSRFYPAPPGAARRGLGETVALLKKQSFVNPALPAYEPDAIRAMVEQSYAPYAASGSKMTGPAAQAHVRRIMKRLASAGSDELALNSAQLGIQKGKAVVIEGGAAAEMNANMSAAGTMIVHRAAIQATDQIGHALAFATDKADLGRRIRAIALGTYKQQYITKRYDPAVVRPLADGALAFILGHESTHGYRAHGFDSEAAPDQATALLHSRTHEQIADLGGLQLATRAGFSTKGQLGGVMLLAAYDQLAKEQYAKAGVPQPAGDHPTGMVRYEKAMRFFEGTATQPRRIFLNGVATHGAPLVDAKQRDVIASMPAAAELPTLLGAPPAPATP